jgi:hypothetical protein
VSRCLTSPSGAFEPFRTGNIIWVPSRVSALPLLVNNSCTFIVIRCGVRRLTLGKQQLFESGVAQSGRGSGYTSSAAVDITSQEVRVAFRQAEGRRSGPPVRESTPTQHLPLCAAGG